MSGDLPRITDFFVCVEGCPWCRGCGAVCENHPGTPWEPMLGDGTGCDCGAGAPCPGVPG